MCVCACRTVRAGDGVVLPPFDGKQPKPQRQCAAVRALEVCQTYGEHISYVIRSKAKRVIITQQLRRPDVA